MTLATRCSACGTTFKVVQDQLKVSGGWVRCGRCSEVFNAIEALFEFGSAAAPVESGAGPAAAAPAAASTARAPEAAEPTPATAPTDSTEASAAAAAAIPAAAEPAQDVAARVDGVDAEPTTPPPFAAPEGTPASPAIEPDISGIRVSAATAAPSVAGAPDDDAEPDGTAPPKPTFVRKAERAARWRSPGVRAVLAVLAVLLALLLAGQAAYAWRDLLAVRWPALQPALAQGCQWLGCKIEPLRRIGALSVESSGLQQLPGTTIYRLSVVLRNRGDLPLLLPAFDLQLSGAGGETVLRRVLAAAELGSSSRTIAPGVDLTLEASLNVGDRRISGYTIEAFYP